MIKIPYEQMKFHYTYSHYDYHLVHQEMGLARILLLEAMDPMKITTEMPIEDTKRTRRVFALLPTFFHHGSNNKPLRTMVWLDYYIVEEYYRYGHWRYANKRLVENNEPTN